MLGVTDKAPVNSVEVLVVNADDELEPLRNTEGAVVELQVEPNVGDDPDAQARGRKRVRVDNRKRPEISAVRYDNHVTGPPCECRSECFNKVPAADRAKLLSLINSMDKNRQDQHIAS